MANCLLFAVSLAAFPTHALTTPALQGEPASVDVSESLSVIYNTDNRNSRRADVASQVDDEWGLVSNRVDARAVWKRWKLGLRLDSAWFYTSRTPTDVALGLLEQEYGGSLPEDYTEQDADLFVQKFFEAGDELTDRFVSWNYPAKYSLSYATPNLDVTVGDFYAQFGRGFVLSMRKRDELSGDDTLRGAKATVKLKADPLRLELTALGGTTNPLRIDEASGRQLGTTADVRDGLAYVTEAGMPRIADSQFAPDPSPNFAPDLIVGSELAAKSRWVAVSLAGTHLQRACLDTSAGCAALASDLVRSAGTIDGASLGLDFPDLWGMGALYVEHARQRMTDFRTAELDTRNGSALYANLNFYRKPVSLTFEGKHYRSFYPLRGNVDIGRAREFVTVQSSTVPTTMPVWADTEFEGFNSCVTGGRARADVQVGKRQSVFAWLGRYNTWAESVAAGTCDVDDANLNRVWDYAQGMQLASADHASRADVMVGTRFDSTDRLLSDDYGHPTHVFYRELYARHDLIYGLGGASSLQFQGWHRRRRQTLGGPADPWLQGVTVTSLQWGPKLNLAFGFEYDQNPAFPDLYFNGQLRYELALTQVIPWLVGPSHLVLFGGQRQGGLRCVSGICRVYPPFEGARADLVIGF